MAEWTIQPNGDGGNIKQWASTTNYASETANYIGNTNGAGFIERNIMIMDFSSLPAGATITSAILGYYRLSTLGNQTIYASRVVRADVATGQMTWTIYKTSNNWATAGCGNTSTDYTTTNQASVSVTDGGTGWMNLTVTDMVKYAQANTSQIIIFRLHSGNEDSAQNYVRVYTGKRTTASERPKLVITYSVSGRPIAMLF